MNYKLYGTAMVLIVTMACPKAIAQKAENYPEIGKPIPEFVLENIKYFSKNKANNKDFAGKHLILDFWNKYCISCVKSFPKVNGLALKYKENLNMLLVGFQEEGIEDMYERFRKQQGLSLSAAFDSSVYRQFVPGGAPHLIWIDNKGIVQAITGSTELTDANIEAFIDGKNFPFIETSHKAYADLSKLYDWNKPYLIDGNGGASTDFMFRSLLAEYRPGAPTKGLMGPINEFIEFVQSEQNVYEKFEFEAVFSLPMLYTYAYTGQTEWYYGDSLYNIFYSKPLIEVDSLDFFPDWSTGKNIYWYSLIVPPAKLTSEYILKGIQRDLAYYLGFEARVEKRKLPYLKMIATPDAQGKLKTKRGKTFVEADQTKYMGTNVPLESFFKVFCYAVGESVKVPFVNETGIKYNVDINADFTFQTFDDIKRLLNKHGIDLVKAEKEFNVIVVKKGK